MKRSRKLAASMVVTVGMISGCHPAGPDHPEPTRNPPMPTVTTPTTDPPPDPTPDPDEEPEKKPDAPTAEGELIREGHLCFWLPATPELECPEDATCNPPPPPMRVPVRCPPLPEAPEDERVEIREDGTCFYWKSLKNDCPMGAHCNPPPPQRIDVVCRPNP